MRRADRLFHLVQLLRLRRFRTAAELAAELEVSQRTVYRDVADLIGTGVPIEGEPGVGYRLLPGFELPPLTFNREEIEALVLGARMVQAWAGGELADAARHAIAKIEAVLPPPLRATLEATALYAPAGMASQQLAMAGLDAIRHAVAERKKLEFGYTDQNAASSTRVVRPLGLYFWGSKWSVAAYCELRQDYRNFRPDRMTGLVVRGDSWSPDEGINLAAFLAQVDRGPG